MENKYYDLIVENIKSHKKYPGLEDILDDIVNDVYEHAKVVIESGVSEEVLNSYIQKVVSTSIITVSRKLGLKNRNSQRSINDILPAPKSEIIQEEVIIDNEDDAYSEDVFTEGFVEEEPEVDAYENAFVEEVPEEDAFEDVFEEFAEEIEDVIADDVSEEVVDEEVLIEPVEETFKTEIEEEIFDRHIADVDQSLVDKMINGVTEEFVNEDVEPEVVTDIETFDIVEEIDVIEEEDTYADVLSLDETDIVAMDETQDFNSALLIDEDSEFESTEVSVDEEIVLSVEPDFVKPEYARFDFVPNVSPSIDMNDLCNDIDELDKKYSELHIKSVWEMKYNKKMTIDEITNELGVSKEIVIEALCELADVIRG